MNAPNPFPNNGASFPSSIPAFAASNLAGTANESLELAMLAIRSNPSEIFVLYKANDPNVRHTITRHVLAINGDRCLFLLQFLMINVAAIPIAPAKNTIENRDPQIASENMHDIIPVIHVVSRPFSFCGYLSFM